jgi:hypothetical protein
VSTSKPSWLVAIAGVTIPPALALAAIYFVSKHEPPPASPAGYVLAAEGTEAQEPESDLGSLPAETLQWVAPPNSDVRMALFAMREAAQSHLVCDALRVMSYSKVEPEEIDKISRKVIEGTKEISIPLLRRQIEDSSGDQETRALLEAIGGLQHLVVAEAEAIRHFAAVDASPESALEVFEATQAYQKRVSELMEQLDGKGE